MATSQPYAGQLHFFCGLIASGKSTLARKIAAEETAILFEEDAWLGGLWPDAVTSLDAYRLHSRRLKTMLWPHVGALLARGLTVVMDFPANTRGQRAAFAELLALGNAEHVLHYLEAPAALCRERLAARNAAGDHPFAPSVEDFERFARYFEPPQPGEGFTVRVWPAASPIR